MTATHKDCIEIRDFKISTKSDYAVLSCRVLSEGFPSKLWFGTNIINKSLLSIDTPNWALVALLYPAMLMGRRIVIRANVSPKLLHNLQNEVQAFLRIYDPKLVKISIDSDGLCSAEPKRGKGVATGFSAGIDTFATLGRYLYGPIHKSMKISYIAIFDVGAFGSYRTEDVYIAALRKGRDFASKHGLGLLDTRSNLRNFYDVPGMPKTKFEKTNTFRNATAALIFERGLRAYYISSSYAPCNISVKQTYNPAYFDPVTLPLLSTERMELVSSCADMTRIEKTEMISELPAAYELLNVCTGSGKRRLAKDMLNCSKCTKCTRTLVTLECIGKIDKFKRVFNLNEYRKNRQKSLLKLLKSANKGNPLDAEVIQLLREKDGKIPTRLSYIFSLIKGLFKTKHINGC